MLPDLGWDHNAWYHRLVLRQLPEDLDDVLEIGCGAGTLATRLARRARHVDALDRAPHMVALAQALVPVNVTVRLADVATAELAADHYDAVTSVSVLHHLDLPTVLPRLAATVRPGGVLVAVALPRVDLPRELPVEAVATLVSRAMGASSRLEGALTGRRRLAREASHDLMPIEDPTLTTAEVRRIATAALPGVQVRRLLFWRYLLIWHRPGRT